MTTVPAHSFSAPARAWVIAAARFMPGVWAVLMSSSLERTTRTPSRRHRVSLRSSMGVHSLASSERGEAAVDVRVGNLSPKAIDEQPLARVALAGAGGDARLALNSAHDRRLACDGSDAPDCARAHRRRAH